MMPDDPADKPEKDGDSAEIAATEKRLTELIKAKLPNEPIQPEQLVGIIARFVAVEVRESYQGPLPPPKMLAEYRKVDPSFAERIMARAEKEQDFRHEIGRAGMAIESRNATHRAIYAYVAQGVAGVLAATAIGGGVYLAAGDHKSEGLGTIITAVSGLVIVFITGKVSSLVAKKIGAKGDSEGPSEE